MVGDTIVGIRSHPLRPRLPLRFLGTVSRARRFSFPTTILSSVPFAPNRAIVDFVNMGSTSEFFNIPLDPPPDKADPEWVLIDTDDDDIPPPPNYATGGSDVDTDDENDDHAHGELIPRRKPGGYDSRVEQMLYENPELPILITDAGKSSESGGRYIVYTIKTGVSDVPKITRLCGTNCC